MATQSRSEFSLALAAIAKERGLEPEAVLATIREAIVAAYRRDARERGEDVEEQLLEAKIDPQTGEARIFTWEGDLENPPADGEKQDITPPGFGRIAAQTAKQVILQKIREAEKDAIMVQYEGRIGSLVSGTVLRFDGANVRVDIGRTEGFMPSNERIPTERLNVSQRAVFLLKEIRETERGKEIILSRSDPELVKKLFAREVPEIASGAVEIKAIAREAGARTKIAVSSSQPGVDPVGSCVGQKGVRVQAVINELNGEKIDVIPWTENAADLIVSALAPAEGVSVVLDEEKKEARVKVPEDQLSLAIGREGGNVRLAVHLTGWRIEIEGTPVEKIETEKAEEVSKVPQVSQEGTNETAVADSADDTTGQTSQDNNRGQDDSGSTSESNAQAQTSDDTQIQDDSQAHSVPGETGDLEGTPTDVAEEK